MVGGDVVRRLVVAHAPSSSVMVRRRQEEEEEEELYPVKKGGKREKLEHVEFLRQRHKLATKSSNEYQNRIHGIQGEPPSHHARINDDISTGRFKEFARD